MVVAEVDDDRPAAAGEERRPRTGRVSGVVAVAQGGLGDFNIVGKLDATSMWVVFIRHSVVEREIRGSQFIDRAERVRE